MMFSFCIKAERERLSYVMVREIEPLCSSLIASPLLLLVFCISLLLGDVAHFFLHVCAMHKYGSCTHAALYSCRARISQTVHIMICSAVTQSTALCKFHGRRFCFVSWAKWVRERAPNTVSAVVRGPVIKNTIKSAFLSMGGVHSHWLDLIWSKIQM